MQRAKLDELNRVYIYPDGTKIPQELVDSVESMLDLLYICIIRGKQRKEN